ncbi:MAG: DUF3617 family protein [Sphingomonadales bacterium]|nr:DUF3617 family protein [Sphingomonadales bacterium]
MNVVSPPSLALCAMVAVLALGACKKNEVDEKNVNPGTVAAKVAAAGDKPQPGRWETTLKLDSIDMPGMPPEAKAMMSKQMGTMRKFATCLSQEDAARPEAEFFNQGKSGCKYDNFTMSDGHLDANMTCKQGPGTMRMTLSGSYSATDYEVHTNTTMIEPGGKGMTQAMTMTAHRAGDCRGDEMNAKKG